MKILILNRLFAKLRIFNLKLLFNKYFKKSKEAESFWQLLKNPDSEFGIMTSYVYNPKDIENKLNELKFSNLQMKLSKLKLFIFFDDIYKYTYEHEVGEIRAEKFLIFKVNKRKDVIDLMHEYDQQCVIYKKRNMFYVINSNEITVKTLVIKTNFKKLLKLNEKHLNLLFSVFVEEKFKEKKFTFKNIYVMERFSGFKRYLLLSKSYKIKWYKLI